MQLLNSALPKSRKEFGDYRTEARVALDWQAPDYRTEARVALDCQAPDYRTEARVASDWQASGLGVWVQLREKFLKV